MNKIRKTLLSTYHYDPLDRLSGTHVTQRFYNNTRIAMEIEGDRKTRFFEADAQPLALQQHGSAPGATLLATDLQTSVLSGIGPDDNPHAQAFTPFGHHANDALLSVMGFNGERPDPVTGHYLLGQGYRAFNPVLMRFNSPDSWSPFGEAGINTYTYCDNEPVMRQDSTGHLWQWAKILGRGIGVVNTTKRTNSRILRLYAKVRIGIKNLDPDFDGTAHTLNDKTTELVRGKTGEIISKSRSALKAASEKTDAANALSSQQGLTKSDRGFFSNTVSREATGSSQIHNPQGVIRNQANMDSGINNIVRDKRRSALNTLKNAEYNLSLLIAVRDIRTL